MVIIWDKVMVNNKVERKFNVFIADMIKMKINIYRFKEKNLLFVIDEGCELFVIMIVQMLDIKGGIKRAVIIFIEFGKIEIFFLGKDENIGVEMQVFMEMIW